MKSLRELVEISETLANDLFGSTNEFSTYAYGDNVDNNSFITKIENRDNYTKVTLKYVSVNPKQTLGIARNAYIEDMTTHQKYMLTDAANINILDQNNKLGKQIGSGIWEYHLFFDRISEDALNIAIVEPNGRKYNDIVLRPYDDENTFVFIDNTQKLYDEMKKQKENQYENEQIEKIDSKDIVVSYYNREAVKGLKYVTTIKTTNNNQPGWPNVCIRKMKKEAAKLGCKAIVIIDETKFRHFDSPSSLTGELYK